MLRTRVDLNFEPLSLLWPDGLPTQPPQTIPWDHDIGLSELVDALTTDRRYKATIRQILATLTTDTAIISYRQGVLADFVANPALVDAVEDLLPRLADIQQGHVMFGKQRRNVLLATADRLSELDLYTEVILDLHGALVKATLQSDALATLRDRLDDLVNDEGFVGLRAQLPELREPLQNIVSLTVGINLTADLEPMSAVLLSINDTPRGDGFGLLNQIIGRTGNDDAETGLTPLHRLPTDPDRRLFSPLFQDLDRLLTTTAQPVARALKKYVQTSSGPLVGLERELAFYAAAARLMQQLGAYGVGFCRPGVLPMGSRETHISGLRNINLCSRTASRAVDSDVMFDEAGRIAILTGPNSGGKTTYLRGVGLAQVMFQAGLFIPAESARMSPVDRLLTHFPALETRQQGRLEEEASRLREIFADVTPNTLVLLNETFSSTALGEALYLAQDVLAGLRAVGARAIFATKPG